MDGVKGGAYSDEQFRALVQKYRKEAEKKKKAKNKARKEIRKLVKLSKAEKEKGSDEEAAAEGNSPVGVSVGAQFGSNGNKSKKSKSWLGRPAIKNTPCRCAFHF